MATTVLVGGFSNSIEIFELDIKDDVQATTFSHKEKVVCDEHPAFLDVIDEHVYAVHELSSYKDQKSGGISYFTLADMKMKHVMSSFSSGQDPCHINVNHSRGCVYISNYASGHFAVLKLKDRRPAGGMYIESYDRGSGVNKERQQTSHPHGAYFYDQFVYVTDLGADKIWHYKHNEGEFDTASPAFTNTPPGSGPRHMAIFEKEKLAFLLTELTCEVIVYRIDETTGALTQLSSYKYLPESATGENYGAEIYIHPNKKFLYLSNRVNGMILVYEIRDTEKGVLEHVQNFETVGTWPRHFNIHSCGKILLCADQFKETIEVVSIHTDTGKLERLQTVECKNKPACIAFKD